MHVIGTAGHVDHGKSTLTRALTGIDPDRLEEEQRREMTIDIGFAWLDLPGGERVGIVDVPGHRDFIENMLAGVGGIDAGVLVVAADEGVMPQTREHLAILDLLAVPTGLIALTKTDMVDDPEWLELVQLDVLDIVQGTVLEGQPVIPVSAHTGDGLDRFVAVLEDLLAHHPARPDIGNPRLAVDRVFTISGFGVVVTGTLRDGVLTVGQEVELQPAGVQARIRGMQAHEEDITAAQPGQRVAVNLRGVEKADIARGDVLGLPGAWHPTTLVDAWLRYLPAAHQPLAHNDEIKFFVGAAEIMGRVRVLDRERVMPGEEAWIQIRLDRPVIAAQGDRYIIRRASPPETIGGGVVLDTAPGRRWKRYKPDVIARFETLLDGDPLAIRLLELSERRTPVRRESLDLNPEQARRAIESGELQVLNDSEWVVHTTQWARIVERVTRALAAFHREQPLRLGLPREALRNRLRLEPEPFEAVLAELATHDHIALASNGAVCVPGHTIRYTAAQTNAITDLLAQFDQSPHTPPTAQQVRESAGDDVLISLIERGELVRVSEDVLLHPDVLRDWVAFARATLERETPLTVAVLRDHFQTTRRYALDFLERLDALRITRRVGDERVRGPGSWALILSDAD